MAEHPEFMRTDQLTAELARLQSAEPAGPGEQVLRLREEELRSYRQRLAETQKQLDRLRQAHVELYEQSPVGHVSLDPGGRVEEINATAAQLLGLSKNQIVGRPFSDFVFEADRPRLLDHLRQCESQDRPWVTDLSLRTPDGQVLPVQLTTEPREIPIVSGTRTVTHRVCRTAITRLAERQRVEEELQASEARLKLAQAAGGVGSWDLDLVTRELRWSDEHFLLLGLQPHSVRPSYHVWRQSLHPEDREHLTVAGLCREDVSTVALDYRIVRPDGQVRWLSTRGKVLRDRLGQRVRMIGVTMDVTNSKETHRRLEELNQTLTDRNREAEQRNEQLRVLATQLTQAENRERRRLALLLHDHLQQLLIASRMKLGVLKQTVKEERSAGWLAQTAALIDEAIAASRSLSVELSPPMLYESGLAAALEWLGRQMEEKHGLKVAVKATDEPEDDDIRVFLFQCVRELLFNTVKHAEVTGAEVTLGRLDADRIIITVADQGQGFELSTLRERWSQGDSFGLRSIHERLGLLGGRFEIRTAPGQGMTATLIAPVRKPRSGGSDSALETWLAAAKTTAPLPGQAGATAINILLADAGQSPIRQGLTRVLENEPDFNIVAQIGDTQTAVNAASSLPVDVVVMDCNAPQIDGPEATRRILALNPGLPVIGLSLHMDHSIAEPMQQAGAVAVLRKDEPSENLVRAIRRLVSERRKAADDTQ